MKIDSIEQIRTEKNELKENLKTIVVKEFENQTFGKESEYDVKGLKAGLDAIITDISALLKAPKRFLQRSTCDERQEMANSLNYLNEAIVSLDLENVSLYVEHLKPILRSYDIRYTEARFVEFVERTNELQRKVEELSETAIDSERTHQSIREICDNAISKNEEMESLSQELSRKYDELGTLIEEADATRGLIETNFADDKANSAEIHDLLAESKSHKAVIESFSKKVVERENQLESQESLTNTYTETLESFTDQQGRYIEKAKTLIENAKKALEYTTAEGLSTAFATQHKKANSIWVMGAWIVSAIVFVLCAAGLGVWLTLDKDATLSIIIGRVSLIPIFIGGAIFCASQFVKQKKLAEDYAYKTVLAKSLVGFSEQLKSDSGKSDEYSLYIRSVLSQMLVDPQRVQTRTEKASVGLDELNSLASTVKELKKKVESFKS